MKRQVNWGCCSQVDTNLKLNNRD